jgi:hypothetical protein
MMRVTQCTLLLLLLLLQLPLWEWATIIQLKLNLWNAPPARVWMLKYVKTVNAQQIPANLRSSCGRIS